MPSFSFKNTVTLAAAAFTLSLPACGLRSKPTEAGKTEPTVGLVSGKDRASAPPPPLKDTNPAVSGADAFAQLKPPTLATPSGTSTPPPTLVKTDPTTKVPPPKKDPTAQAKEAPKKEPAADPVPVKISHGQVKEFKVPEIGETVILDFVGKGPLAVTFKPKVDSETKVKFWIGFPLNDKTGNVAERDIPASPARKTTDIPGKGLFTAGCEKNGDLVVGHASTVGPNVEILTRLVITRSRSGAKVVVIPDPENVTK